MDTVRATLPPPLSREQSHSKSGVFFNKEHSIQSLNLLTRWGHSGLMTYTLYKLYGVNEDDSTYFMDKAK